MQAWLGESINAIKPNTYFVEVKVQDGKRVAEFWRRGQTLEYVKHVPMLHDPDLDIKETSNNIAEVEQMETELLEGLLEDEHNTATEDIDWSRTCRACGHVHIRGRLSNFKSTGRCLECGAGRGLIFS